jgi:hypothetical protein
VSRVKAFSSKRSVIYVAVVVLLTLFLLRPGASRMTSRIAGALGSALGRPVEIGSVHIRLLPRPGFDLQDLVIYDDPAFGSEPMLRCSEVTAALRLTSLVRGRLEIARLDLTEPSLNLAQGENGRWNVEALLERSAHIPLAPTSKAKSELRPGFPYIAASSARINFKRGQEKKPYALTSADFSLWQDSENAWGVRLQAQPIRTDVSLNDTGVLQISGSWQRADRLRDTPLKFEMEWDRPQLGQLTKFLTGRDSGWRGSVQFTSTLSGTPGKLLISSDASVQDFRRYDITSGEPLKLAAHCDGEYSSIDRTFREVLCSAPAGRGSVTLKGELGLPGSHRYSVQLNADEFPASALVVLVRHAKKNLPPDLLAGGTVRGNLSIRQKATDAAATFGGQGEISDFHLASATSKAEIGPETIPFSVDGGPPSPRLKATQKTKATTGVHTPEVLYLEVGPVSLGAGIVAPKAQGWINPSGYRVSLTGDGEVAGTLNLARMLGLAATTASAEGRAQLDLLIAGSWTRADSSGASGFVVPQVTGTAKLRDLRFGIRGVEEKIDVSSAELQLTASGARVAKLTAKAAGTVWAGSLDLPRGCGALDACLIHFDLNGNRVNLNELMSWINPGPKSRPWYGVLTSGTTSAPSPWMTLRASGRVSTNHLLIRGLEATRFSTNLILDDGKVHLANMAADFLGGKYTGEWKADFSTKPATYISTGDFSAVALAQATDTPKGPWSTGTGDGSYQVKGMAAPGDFWQSAEGGLRFDIRDASLPSMALSEDAEPLRLSTLTGVARVHAGRIEIRQAALDSSTGKFEVTGSASLSRELDFKLTRKNSIPDSSGFAIAGTLDNPLITPSVAAPKQDEDQLKAQAAK